MEQMVTEVELQVQSVVSIPSDEDETDESGSQVTIRLGIFVASRYFC